MADIVIIGAGLTGLSVAYHLEKNGFHDYQLFEKDDSCGGLCRSITQDQFTFDYTGHLLHASDPYFKELINSLVGFEHLNIINRQSFIYSHGTYTRYPFQSNLFGLPATVISECIEEFVKKPKLRHQPRSFHEWVLAHFGKGIARHFFFPFQNKIFAYNIRKISPTWMGRFVPSTTLSQLIQGSIADTSSSIGYNAHFVYPKKGGIQFWIEKLAQKIKNSIHTGYKATRIDTKEKIVHFQNGHTEPYTHLINTTPLDQFLDSFIDNSSTTSLRQASSNLLCNSVVNFNIGIKKPALTTKHWIYFPETHFPFYRIGFPHNFTSTSVPENCSSLYGELSYLKKPKIPLEKLLKNALQATKKLLGFEDHDIATQKIITIPHAYVIYDFWREQHLPGIMERLEDFSIQSIGRYGGWKYSSMQEAVLDGKAAAEKTLLLL